MRPPSTIRVALKASELTVVVVLPIPVVIISIPLPIILGPSRPSLPTIIVLDWGVYRYGVGAPSFGISEYGEPYVGKPDIHRFGRVSVKAFICAPPCPMACPARYHATQDHVGVQGLGALHVMPHLSRSQFLL